LTEVGAWDYIILDEAHKIRNHTTKTAISVSEVKGKHKVLLTGTPIMDNLRVRFCFKYLVNSFPY
jgi:SNF2 family DNA or RNA helicase